jgi:predicted nucleotidyltransferase
MSTNAPSLAEALFSKSRRAILGLMFRSSHQRFYLREIVDKTGLGVGNVQRELDRLSRAGILRRTHEGRHVYFQANEQCPVFQDLRSIVTKTIGAVDVLRQALAEQTRKIRVAFVFGSVARQQDQADSDLDLMIVGEVQFAEVARALRTAEADLGRETNATVYPTHEFVTKLRDGNHFLQTVVKQPKMFVVGDDRELTKLLEQPVDQYG